MRVVVLALALALAGLLALYWTTYHRRTCSSASSHGQWDYSIVEGFFAQDAPEDGIVDEAVMPRLGLLDDSPDRWSKFYAKIKELQHDAPKGVRYKVLYVQRHGQGYHNVAESQYGTKAWDAVYSKLYTDGNTTWGPDPALTLLGQEQALNVAAEWALEIPNGARLPDVIWSSPLRRAAHTLALTYEKTAIAQGVRPMFKEGLRECIGLHTCDARQSSYFLATTFARLQNPSNPLNFDFEPGFRVNDELWRPNERETAEHQQARTTKILDELFATEDAIDFAGIVGHGGTINALFAVTGHRPCRAPTGAFIPMVVRADPHGRQRA